MSTVLETRQISVQSEIKTQRNDLLKLFAMITMLIDHIGYMFFPKLLILRTIGRLAFPIFAYQVAIGYTKTSSRRDYAKRLFVFGLISQIPYLFFNPELKFEPYGLNIMFTLLVALGLINIYEKGKQFLKSYKQEGKLKNLLLSVTMFICCFLIIFVPELIEIKTNISLEYGFYGLLLVLLFYIFKDSKPKMLIAYILLSMFYAYFVSAKYLVMYRDYKSVFDTLLRYRLIVDNFMLYNNKYLKLEGVFFQARSILSLVAIYLLCFLEGRMNFKIRLNKYVGYLFYPVHIAILILIAYYIKR